MVEYGNAIEIILQSTNILGIEPTSIEHVLNRVLAEDIISDIDMPPFNKSAVDGYACRKEDIGKKLKIVETIYAGSGAQIRIEKGCCSKIMTGAAIPDGADCVFMIEDAIENGYVTCTKPILKTNICKIGEDIQKGDKLILRNTLITSRHIPILATAGMDVIEVYKQPKIGVFATGAELVEVGKEPGPFQIRNSNSLQIMAQISDLGIQSHFKGIIDDNHTDIENAIEIATSEFDLAIFTGGVSVGERDLLPEVLESRGYQKLITKTAIQPGKPMIFAKNENHFCFGLSGNPVSCYIQFQIYVKPFIYGLMGCKYLSRVYSFPLASTFERRKNDRLQFVPGIINEKNKVVSIPFHGSAHINSFGKATCLFEIPIGKKEVLKDEFVTVHFLC